MRKKIPSLTMSILLIIAMLAGIDFVFDVTETALAATIYVDGDHTGPEDGSPTYPFNTIQEACDDANSGDTVYVYFCSSPYVEDVFLNTTIDLVGDSWPEIDGFVWVYGSDCFITGVKNYVGLNVIGSNCEINSNKILGGYGINIDADGVIIRNNDINNNLVGIFSSGDNAIIDGNRIYYSIEHGIWVGADRFIIKDNEISDSGVYGIWLDGMATWPNSIDHQIYNNTFTNEFEWINDCSNIKVFNNTFENSGLQLENLEYVEVYDNDFLSFSGGGVTVSYGSYIQLIDNQMINCEVGVSVWSSDNITIHNCTIENAGYYGFDVSRSMVSITSSSINNSGDGVYVYDESDVSIHDCNIENANYGLNVVDSFVVISGSSIINSKSYAMDIGGGAIPSTIISSNTCFNKSNVNFLDYDSTLNVKWYLWVNVKDKFGNPVTDAFVKVEDNANGTFEHTQLTGVDGFVLWSVTEYIQTKSYKTYYTPHKVVAWNDTHVGYAKPFMDRYKVVNITLEEGVIQKLSPGSNFISMSVIPSETETNKVLDSIKDQYDMIWKYNSTETNDPWKLYHTIKPAQMNDLYTLNHTDGIWVNLNDPCETILVLNGSKPSYPQNISLNPGWNMVGYPSLTNYIRTDGLNNLVFNNHVDAIWTYNNTNQRWDEIGPSNYFEIGRGYWIHAKKKCVWEVPL